MSYWGYHPMEGDTPLDDCGTVQSWLIETLISDIECEETSGKNEKISDYLRNFVIERDFDKDKIFNDFFMDNYEFNKEVELWNTYKYELINNFKDERTEYEENSYFVIPYRFIDMDIHVKPEYVKYLKNMLGDGGAKSRGYDTYKIIYDGSYDGYTLDDFDENHDHPLYYILLTKKYASQLFDETNDELNDEFVAQHPEIRDVVSKGLFESAFKILEETGEVPFMNVD